MSNTVVFPVVADNNEGTLVGQLTLHKSFLPISGAVYLVPGIKVVENEPIEVIFLTRLLSPKSEELTLS